MGYYVTFDGSNDFGQIPHHSDLSLTSNWEITMIFKPFNMSATTDYLMFKPSVYGLYWEYTNDNVQFQSNIANYPDLRTTSAIPLTSADKTKVTYSYDGTTFRQYKNDVLLKETVTSATLNTSTNPLIIGAGSISGTSPFKGNIYYVSLKKDGVLVAEYKFLEGSGTTVQDSTGRGHTMTLSGGPVWGSEPDPILHEGSASLSSTSSMTVSANKIQAISVSLSSDSSISANLQTVSTLHEGSASFNSTSSINATADVSYAGVLLSASASMSSSGDLTANAMVEAYVQEVWASSTMYANSSLTADASVELIVREVQASASFTSDGSLVATAMIVRIVDISASLISESVMTVLNVSPIDVDVSLIGMRKLTEDFRGMRKLWEELRGGVVLVSGQNFNMVAGTSLNLSIQLSEQDGTPLNLEGVTAVWGFGTIEKGIRKDTTTSGISVTDAGEGMLLIQLKPEDTSGRHENTVHELEIIDTYGNVSTVMRGMIYIEKEIL